MECVGKLFSDLQMNGRFALKPSRPRRHGENAYLGNLFLRRGLTVERRKGSCDAEGFYRNAASTPDVLLMAVILVVEDDAFIRQYAELLIDDLGHDSLLASDLASALLHLSAHHHIDVLFVDLRLHALAFGGYDVANQAIGLRPGLRVLYTSGSSLTDDMTGRFVPGGRFLQKPYSPAQIESSLGELLH